MLIGMGMPGLGISAAAPSTPTVIGTFGVAESSNRALGSVAAANHGGLQFVATVTGTISEVKALVVTAGSVNFTAELWSNSSGSPGAIIGTASNAVSMSTTGSKTFTFDTPPSISNGTTYWIILKNAGSTDVYFSVCTDQASYGSGRNSTITSITDDGLGASQNWRVEITQMS